MDTSIKKNTDTPSISKLVLLRACMNFIAGDTEKDRVWICEHNNRIIGFLLLMHREKNSAQLRYFILLPGYRGIDLGKKLMDLYISCLKERRYSTCYLWTTNEQTEAGELYKKYGFQLVEEHDSSAFGKPLKEQRFVLILNEQ